MINYCKKIVDDRQENVDNQKYCPDCDHWQGYSLPSAIVRGIIFPRIEQNFMCD